MAAESHPKSAGLAHFRKAAKEVVSVQRIAHEASSAAHRRLRQECDNPPKDLWGFTQVNKTFVVLSLSLLLFFSLSFFFSLSPSFILSLYLVMFLPLLTSSHLFFLFAVV
jgi:hypothetical protein